MVFRRHLKSSGDVIEFRDDLVDIHHMIDPKTYVELETLGPLVTLKPGDLAAATNLYTLTERHSGDDAVMAARRALGLP